MNIANKISTFRILSVPFFIASLLYYSPQRDFLRFIALAIFSLAVISDAVDGYFARKNKEKTQAGLVLDPLADKLLLISAFICLYFIEGFPLKIKFPLWVILVVISRDTIILLGAMLIYIIKNNLEIYPTRWGKLTTFFQMASVIAVLLQLSFSFFFWVLATFFTIISGIDYIRRGLGVLYGANHR